MTKPTPADQEEPEHGQDTPDESTSHFDAVAAAEELARAMGEADQQPEPPTTSIYIEELEREIEALNNLLAQKDAQLAKAATKLDEMLADVSRSSERIERESQKQLQARTDKLLGAFLEVLDDMDRALGAARAANHAPEMVRGVELVRQRFLATLQSFGVRPQNAEGVAFDPALHDAVGTFPASAAHPAGTVAAVTRPGYTIDDRVLRPAAVVVAKSA